jgi:5-dehydro-2-deoxygluconokinase
MDVIVMGRIGYDLYAEELHRALPDVRTFSRYLGGSSANMAVGLARLGCRVGMVSCLGTDRLSDFLLAFLSQEGVQTTHVQRRSGYLPSLAITEVSPPDSFPQVFYRHNAVDVQLDASEGDLRYAASGRMFVTNGTALCGSPSRESAYLALERAKAAGCRVVLDIDYRAMSWPSAAHAGLAVRLALPYVDVLIGNPLEFQLAGGADTLEAAVERLRERGVPLLVSKLGEEGTRLHGAGAPVFLPPYRVEVCTTIGAGDGFASGFLYALLRGEPLERSLHYGNAAAAIVVSRLSCSEAMPTLDEVETMIGRQG